MHLLENSKSHFAEIFVISPSSFSGAWKNTCVPESNVRDEWSENWMLQLIERLSAKNKGKNQQSTDFVRVLVVLDIKAGTVLSSLLPRPLTAACRHGRRHARRR
jgi:hypothetical protein